MYLNGFIQTDADDKIEGATCTVDGSPIIRFAALSINLSWEQLEKLQAEIIRLQCAANQSERVAGFAHDVVNSLHAAE